MKGTGFYDNDIYTGTMTAGARKRMGRAVSLLVQMNPERWIINPVTGKRMKFRLNFITLTVASTDRMLDAATGHKLLLEPMLKHFRDIYDMHSYVWKAEPQKRGQIHYHITTDVLIHQKKLQEKWNKLQKKHGLLDGFHEKYGHWMPPSTEIKPVTKINNIEAYLVKYLGKNGGRDKAAEAWIKRFSKKRVTREPDGSVYTTLPASYFNHIRLAVTKGKVWDCSVNLKHGKYYTGVVDETKCLNIEYYVKSDLARIEHHEHFSIILFKNIPAFKVLSSEEQLDYHAHLEEIKHYKRSEPDKVPLAVPKPEIIIDTSPGGRRWEEVKKKYATGTLFKVAS